MGSDYPEVATKLSNLASVMNYLDKVDEAKLVSSCFNCPSNANPNLSLLLARSGVREYILERLNPGPIGQDSLEKGLDRMRRG